jgi:predicted nucleic acid-binding protein
VLDTNVVAALRVRGRILATYRVPEHSPLDDALIAAIAQAAAMTIVTCNTRHFEPLGVACLNPWGHSA